MGKDARPCSAVSASIPPQSRLERARRLLRLARSAPETRLSFGGRVKNFGVDVPRSLRNYYRSLEVARRLARLPEMTGGVRAFLDRVSMPDDLRPLLEQAVEMPEAPDPGPAGGGSMAVSAAEPAAELGRKSPSGAALATAQAASDPGDLAVTDPSLLAAVTSGQLPLPPNCLFRPGSPPAMKIAALRLVARAAELRLPVHIRDFRELAAAVPVTIEGARVLRRVGVAFAVDLSPLPFGGTTLGAFGAERPRAGAQILSADARRFAELDPAKAKTLAERRQAVKALLLAADSTPELGLLALLLAAVELKAKGKLRPVGLAGLGETSQVEWLESCLEGLEPLCAGALAVGLFASVAPKRLEQALGQLGMPAEQAQSWSRVAAQLGPMDASDQSFVLGPLWSEGGPEFGAVPVRLALLDMKLDDRSLDEGFSVAKDVDPYGFVEAAIDRAAQTPAGSLERLHVRRFVHRQLDAGALDPELVRRLVRPRDLAVLNPEADEAVRASVAAVSGPDPRPKSISELVRALEKASRFANPSQLCEEILGQIHQTDLARVMPLARADAELGGVGPPSFQGPPPFPPGTKTVRVASIELKAHDRPDKDEEAVPREENAELILTGTTERNLRLIATAWRRAQPVLLEGPTSSGKTSAIRYLAYKTGSPYRRINLSPFTEVEDLLGRYVAGDRHADRAWLEKKSEAELQAIGEAYGAVEGMQRRSLIEHVLEAREKPRWEDGPLVSAMKKGEVVLLDEMNLARPEVLERLNSLFDDDENIVLTEHRNEVIRPDPNFRLFGAMNPASYAGRARLSDATRSRWNNVYTHGLGASDLTTIMKTRYGTQIALPELAKLVAVHDNLSRAADEGEMGGTTGGLAFTLRNLFRVAERFVRFRGGELSDEALMRRETEEVYAGGLIDQDDISHVRDVLATAMPYDGPDFYAQLELAEDQHGFRIGDVSVKKLGIEHPLVPGEGARLVMTPRTAQVLYRLAKALDCGENVALIGERASGKTAIAKLFAMLRQQPYQRQNLHGSTDASQLIGGYDPTGWRDGLLLDASRPDNPPGVFVADEFNLAPPALLERLNSVLDDERKLVLAERAPPEEVELHPEFRFIAAMNPPTAKYGGRAKLSFAMQNRFTMIRVPELEDKEEQKIILRAIGAKKGVPEPIIDGLVELQRRILDSYASGELGGDVRERDRPVYSIRSLLKAIDYVSEFQGQLGPAPAYLLAVETTYAASPEPSDNEAILEMAKMVAS